MFIDEITKRLVACGPYKEFLHPLDDGNDVTLGVPQSARPLVVASVYAREPRPMLVIVSGDGAAIKFSNTLAAYIGRDRVMTLPARSDTPWSGAAPDLSQVTRRCKAIHALKTGREVVVVTSARALLRCVPPGGADVFSPYRFTVGEEVVFEEIPAMLVRAGFTRLDELDGPGTFMLHGDVLDIFPGDLPYPVRIDFFGDEVERIRRLVPATGQSIGDLDTVQIFPCREMFPSASGVKRAEATLRQTAQSDTQLAADLELLKQGMPFAGMEKYLPYLYKNVATPIDHISSDTLVIPAEPRALFDDATRAFEEISKSAANARAKIDGLYVKPAGLDFGSQQRMTLLSIMTVGSELTSTIKIKRPDLAGTEERMIGGLRAFIAGGMTVALSVPNRRAREAMMLTLSDAHVPFVVRLDYSDEDDENADGSSAPRGRRLLKDGVVNLVDTDIPAGLVIPQAHLALVSLADGTSRTAHRNVQRDVDITKLTFPFKPGDYVVHAQHGVALFSKILRQEVAGVERDYLLLLYAEDDKLYVPVEQIDQVTRYVGPEGASPRLTRLNTSDWVRLTGKARKSAKKLAFDLVDLYARRATVTGFKYSPDTPWQQEMEESFPYTPTPDQLRAIADVKADMESDKPMDRLVCGDVGFGKTEVVLRAAFKAVQDKRQVMVLCPTTILAQQHFTTFSDRFTPFGVDVEVLSRFRTAAQQRRALDGFAEGTVDVLVGTHRLLSRDVNPKNLGLIIIDEEQRFGVQHKEQLKNLREQVDVITLSATPIPRTMQMALSGVRDMSLIETPPPNRMPVKVHVGEWDADVVSAAIRRELARGGQVYYVSNRVKTIDDAVMRVQEAAPEARIGVAHGQMKEHELEAVMETFAAGETDVLVATTIIENGLDNPHTNTLIIEDAQRLGLSQLYQLKGRVGRSYDQAYAYFMFPGKSLLTDDAADRLAAIAEFQELGSGTRIAMRDLEIRGAGNMLGAEQSGNMSAVGFDLYARMIAEAVSAARGEETIANPEIAVDLPADTFLPEEYMPAADERVVVYRQLSGATQPETVEKYRSAVRDKYGALPEAAANLFDKCLIKAYAAKLGITNVAQVGGKIVLTPIDLGAHGMSKAHALGCVYVAKKQRLTRAVPHGESPIVCALDLLSKLVAEQEVDEAELEDDEE